MSASLVLLLAATSSVATSSVATSSVAAPPAPLARAEPEPVTTLEPVLPPCLGAYLRAASVVPRDPAFEAVSTLGAFVRVEAGALWLIDPSWSVELGLGYGAPSARAFERYDLTLSVGSLEAAVAYRVALPWQLEAHGRAQLLADLGHLRVDDDASTPLTDSAIALGGALTAGVSLVLPLDGPEARIGLELGYLLHTGFAFDRLERDVAGGADPSRIDRGSIDAGGISLSGFTWRLGGSIAF